MNRYIVAFAGFMLLVILLLVLIFRGGGKKPQTPTTPVKTLPDYANTTAAVSLTIDGRVNGEDKHRAIRISVDRYHRQLDIISGYSGNIVETHNFDNTEAAYDVFLRSINGGGFMSKSQKYKNNDERGKCPLGLRYIYELNDGGDELSKSWSSTCGSATGTFGGNNSLMLSLFQAQITDYSKLTSKVVL
jgi:hypothetical protein